MDIEAQARELGWVPSEEWRGDPAQWKSAEEFVERGHTVMPMLRKNNEKLLAEVENLRGQITGLTEAVTAGQEALAAFQEFHSETAKREYQRAVQDLKAQKVTAIREGDAERVVEIDDAIDALQAEAPKPLQKAANAPAPAPQVSPENIVILQKWESENASWLSDPEKKAYATAAGGFLRATGNQKTGRAFLDDVAAEVEKRFGTPRKEGTVAGSGVSSSGRPRGRSFADLPKEAQDACDRFGSRLVGKGRAFETLDQWRSKYVNEYVWE